MCSIRLQYTNRRELGVRMQSRYIRREFRYDTPDFKLDILLLTSYKYVFRVPSAMMCDDLYALCLVFEAYDDGTCNLPISGEK